MAEDRSGTHGISVWARSPVVCALFKRARPLPLSSPKQSFAPCRELAWLGGFPSFAKTRSDDEVAPIPAVHGTAIEPPGSVHRGLSSYSGQSHFPLPPGRRVKRPLSVGA